MPRNTSQQSNGASPAPWAFWMRPSSEMRSWANIDEWANEWELKNKKMHQSKNACKYDSTQSKGALSIVTSRSPLYTGRGQAHHRFNTNDMLKKKKSMFHTLFIGKQKPTWRIFAFFGNRGAYFDNWRTTFLIPLVFGKTAAVFSHIDFCFSD